MVRAIATSHGGTVVVETSPELGGAQLVVSLPARDARPVDRSASLIG
jgi:signal transduction histidine kinase